MGVMSCSRYCCENIMCDTHIDDVGYVCWECQKEFKEYLRKSKENPQTEREIKKELKEFMKTEKDSWNESDEMDIDTFFDNNTR